nr:hypothetical protein [uncultured Desulfobulbus sp.]
MDVKKLFIKLIAMFLSGEMTREEIAHEVSMELPIDSYYKNNVELMENCEWALRHINEPDYWTNKNELLYYLTCLQGIQQFSADERDKLLK